MEHAIWLVIIAVCGCGLVIGGFWVINRAQFGKPVLWGFGAIVLIVILFALVAVVHMINGEPWHPFPGW